MNPRMTVNYIKGNEINLTSEIFELNETSFGKLTVLKDRALKEYMMNVDSIDVEYNFMNMLPDIGLSESNCYKWEVA